MRESDVADIAGLELDWFAADASGALALFATAGSGPVPSAVLAIIAACDEISEGLEAPHWGSEAVWGDYARLGLYVFDWRRSSGRYERRAVPSSQPSSDLKDSIERLPALPVIDGLFAEITDLAPAADWLGQ